MENVLSYVAIGKQEAPHLTGGERLQDGDFARGYHVAPAVFTGVTQQKRIASEEIFGPVLAIIEVDSYEDAISCGVGKCARCACIVLAGGERLPAPNWQEKKQLGDRLDQGYRLACQLWINHDIELSQDNIDPRVA